ncbi:MAG TPA: hypothetical protein VGY94_06885, partial [Acidobacteriaceae bacterium]|nr:hypothetical protein [Acidobacteriaceae bacterium]
SGVAVFSRHRNGMTLASSKQEQQILQQTIEQAAHKAGLKILSNTEGADFHGKPTSIFRLGLGADSSAERTLALELSNGFAPVTPEQKQELAVYLQHAAKRLRNPNPNAMVSLAGLPLVFREFKWPFHLSTSGADTYLVHGVVGLEDGAQSPLHTKVAASMTVTFAEVVAAPEQPYAEAFIYNAVRKTLDQGQLEMLKSGNRQPVPVTTRYYSRWQKRFVFSDSTEASRRDFLATKIYWLSVVLGNNKPVWIADPYDAQYLNTSPEELQKDAAALVKDGLLTLDADFATAAAKLAEQGDHYRALLAHALSLTKPEFNEEMRHGHTNM